MLYLNLNRLMRDKGIERPHLFLTKNGFPSYTASRLINNKVSAINTRHLEKLCNAFHCTINDLFVWEPSSETIIADNHPLQKLKAKANNINIGSKLRELSPQKLEEVKEFLKGL